MSLLSAVTARLTPRPHGPAGTHCHPCRTPWAAWDIPSSYSFKKNKSRHQGCPHKESQGKWGKPQAAVGVWGPCTVGCCRSHLPVGVSGNWRSCPHPVSWAQRPGRHLLGRRCAGELSALSDAPVSLVPSPGKAQHWARSHWKTSKGPDAFSQGRWQRLNLRMRGNTPINSTFLKPLNVL